MKKCLDRVEIRLGVEGRVKQAIRKRLCVLIAIIGLTMLDDVQVEDGSLHIGAFTRHGTLRESPVVAMYGPLMSAAWRYVASSQAGA